MVAIGAAAHNINSMNPALLFPIAIFTPFVLTAILLLPIYSGLLGAAYVIYMPASGVHPLDGKMLDVFYIIDVYTKLLDYWAQHSDAVSFTQYTLPILGLPALGIIIALYGSYKLISKLINVFRLSTNI